MSEEFHITRRKAVVWLFLPLMILAAGYSLSQLESRGLNLPWFDMRNGLQLLSMNAVMEKFTDNLMIPLAHFVSVYSRDGYGEFMKLQTNSRMKVHCGFAGKSYGPLLSAIWHRQRF
ncbi:MAG: hypothetical protein ACLRL6_01500 [Clostridium sp.]